MRRVVLSALTCKNLQASAINEPPRVNFYRPAGRWSAVNTHQPFW